MDSPAGIRRITMLFCSKCHSELIFSGEYASNGVKEMIVKFPVYNCSSCKNIHVDSNDPRILLAKPIKVTVYERANILDETLVEILESENRELKEEIQELRIENQYLREQIPVMTI